MSCDLTGKDLIAWRTARFFKDGNVVNLGIGMPTKCLDYLPEGVDIWIDTENGAVGLNGAPQPGEDFDPNVVDAGGRPSKLRVGSACFDSFRSFGFIRGGHVDITVLGAYEVDARACLANWMIPGKKTPGMGGAMDLLVGAKKVILAMEHTAKGNPKILKKCTLPLTAKGQVNMIITEMGVMEITPKGIVLTEINPEFTVEQVQAATEAKLIISENLKKMNA